MPHDSAPLAPAVLILQIYSPSTGQAPHDTRTPLDEVCRIVVQQRGRPLIVAACQIDTLSLWCEMRLLGNQQHADVLLVPITASTIEQDCAIAHELRFMVMSTASPETQRHARLSYLRQRECSPDVLSHLLMTLRQHLNSTTIPAIWDASLTSTQAPASIGACKAPRKDALS